MGKRSGGDKQKRDHGKYVKAKREARRERDEKMMRDLFRPLRLWRVK